MPFVHRISWDVTPWQRQEKNAIIKVKMVHNQSSDKKWVRNGYSMYQTFVSYQVEQDGWSSNTYLVARGVKVCKQFTIDKIFRGVDHHHHDGLRYEITSGFGDNFHVRIDEISNRLDLPFEHRVHWRAAFASRLKNTNLLKHSHQTTTISWENILRNPNLPGSRKNFDLTAFE